MGEFERGKSRCIVLDKCFTDRIVEQDITDICGTDERFMKMVMQLGDITQHLCIDMTAFQKDKFRLGVVINMADDIVMYHDKDKCRK